MKVVTLKNIPEVPAPGAAEPTDGYAGPVHRTRQTIIELADNELGLKVVERSIDRTEIFICEELFMTGTAAEITAVTKIDHRPVGAGVMGPLTTKLRGLYDEVIRARNPKYKQWNVEV